MKIHLVFAVVLLILPLISCFSQSLEEQLLGNWKLQHDEGMEMFLNSPMIKQLPREDYLRNLEWTNKVLENSFMNFFSLDSMTSTIIDKREIIQDKSFWDIRKADSVITYRIRFFPYVQQSKVLRLTDKELVLIYFNEKEKAETLKSTYKKVEN